MVASPIQSISAQSSANNSSPSSIPKTRIKTKRIDSKQYSQKTTITANPPVPNIGTIFGLNPGFFSSKLSIGSRITKSNLISFILHHVLRSLVLIFCIVGCFAQIITIMNIFFSYPAIVFVDIHQMEKLTLPALTICNNNRVMRSKMNAFDEQFAHKWSLLMNSSSNVQGQQNRHLKLYQQQLIDDLVRKMMSDLTISQFMKFGSTADDFFDVGFFRCASDKNHQDKKCIYLSNLFTTAQENGNCFTLFHKSNSTVLEEISIESGLSESAVVRGLNNESVDIEMSLKPFAPNEILRFRVNFREEEYTTLNEPISGKFIIHDNSQIAVIREKSYRIRPGRYYIFYMIKYTDKLLPAPYVTDCRKYDGIQIEQFNDYRNYTASSNILFRAPASKANCLIGCMAKKTIERCNCFPPELPFVFNNNENASENSLKWCDWRQAPPIKNIKDKSNNITWFHYCFNIHEDECNRQCKSDCSIDRYQIISEEIEWPFKERIEHSDDNGELSKLKSCCAVISIRYWSAEQKINEYRPRFEVAEFTSNIGGLLSMWLGFSLFGFYNLNEKYIKKLLIYCKRRKMKKSDKVQGEDREESPYSSSPRYNQTEKSMKKSRIPISSRITSIHHYNKKRTAALIHNSAAITASASASPNIVNSSSFKEYEES